jgi:phospholipase C
VLVKASFAFVVAGPFILAGCSGNGSGSDYWLAAPGLKGATKSEVVSEYIQHVVIIVQENRSFENFFAGHPGSNAPLTGCGRPAELSDGPVVSPGSLSGCPKGDVQTPLHLVTFQQEPNLSHAFEASAHDWDGGKMDGFSSYGRGHDSAAYAYIERSQVATYWTMAQQYVLADAMFPTEFGLSWTAHLTLVAGTDNLNGSNNMALADFATGRSNCHAQAGATTTTVDANRVIGHNGPLPCLDTFNTMAQALDTAGISCKNYVARKYKSFIWSPFAAIKYVYDGYDWDDNIIFPNTKIFADIAQGHLASVSWVTPNYENSDHSGAHSDTGPAWVASIVNAIGKSAYWNSTAIVVLWDDYGGFYDNAAPPRLDIRGLGTRVPCLIISPYAKTGYVSHTQYEFGSILKFIGEAFPKVQPLGPSSQGYTDTRANSISDSFDFARARTFKAIPAKYPISHFLHEAPSSEPVDNE